jgi:hypothetical protein
VASLSEMLAYAKELDERKTPGLDRAITSFMGAYDQGVAQRQKSESAKMDRAYKIMQMTKMQEEMDASKQDRQREEDFGKAFGLIPMSEQEQDAVRGTAFAGIGGVESKPKVNSTRGRLMEMADMAKKSGLKGASYGKYRVSFDDENAGRGSGGWSSDDEMDLNLKADKMSDELALKEVTETLRMNGQYDPMVDPSTLASKYVTQEMKAKYRNAAKRYLRYGDASELDAATSKWKSGLDPFGLYGQKPEKDSGMGSTLKRLLSFGRKS